MNGMNLLYSLLGGGMGNPSLGINPNSLNMGNNIPNQSHALGVAGSGYQVCPTCGGSGRIPVSTPQSHTTVGGRSWVGSYPGGR